MFQLYFKYLCIYKKIFQQVLKIRIHFKYLPNVFNSFKHATQRIERSLRHQHQPLSHNFPRYISRPTAQRRHILKYLNLLLLYKIVWCSHARVLVEKSKSQLKLYTHRSHRKDENQILTSKRFLSRRPYCKINSTKHIIIVQDTHNIYEPKYKFKSTWF